MFTARMARNTAEFRSSWKYFFLNFEPSLSAVIILIFSPPFVNDFDEWSTIKWLASRSPYSLSCYCEITLTIMKWGWLFLCLVTPVQLCTIIIIIIIIIQYVCLLSHAFLPGTSLEPAVIPTAHASSFTLQYFPYYVWCSKYSCLL